MNEEIINILEYNLLSEIKKRELTKEARALILKDYMKRNDTSLRELAKDLNIPHTTLFYWANEEKRKSHLSDIKQRTDLNSVYEAIVLLLDKLENRKLKLNDRDREKITEIKSLCDKLYLFTRVVKI